jgi:hypothetical protein
VVCTAYSIESRSTVSILVNVSDIVPAVHVVEASTSEVAPKIRSPFTAVVNVPLDTPFVALLPSGAWAAPPSVGVECRVVAHFKIHIVGCRVLDDGQHSARTRDIPSHARGIGVEVGHDVIGGGCTCGRGCNYRSARG